MKYVSVAGVYKSLHFYHHEIQVYKITTVKIY